MTTSIYLAAVDVARLTKKTRFSAQRRELERRGIRFVPASDGEPLVRAEDVDAAGKPAHRPRSGPRWHMIGPAASIKNLRP